MIFSKLKRKPINRPFASNHSSTSSLHTNRRTILLNARKREAILAAHPRASFRSWIADLGSSGTRSTMRRGEALKEAEPAQCRESPIKSFDFGPSIDSSVSISALGQQRHSSKAVRPTTPRDAIGRSYHRVSIDQPSYDKAAVPFAMTESSDSVNDGMLFVVAGLNHQATLEQPPSPSPAQHRRRQTEASSQLAYLPPLQHQRRRTDVERPASPKELDEPRTPVKPVRPSSPRTYSVPLAFRAGRDDSASHSAAVSHGRRASAAQEATGGMLLC